MVFKLFCSQLWCVLGVIILLEDNVFFINTVIFRIQTPIDKTPGPLGMNTKPSPSPSALPLPVFLCLPTPNYRHPVTCTKPVWCMADHIFRRPEYPKGSLGDFSITRRHCVVHIFWCLRFPCYTTTWQAISFGLLLTSERLRSVSNWTLDIPKDYKNYFTHSYSEGT